MRKRLVRSIVLGLVLPACGALAESYPCKITDPSNDRRIEGDWSACKGKNLRVTVKSWESEGPCTFTCDDEPPGDLYVCTITSARNSRRIQGDWSRCGGADLQISVANWVEEGPCQYTCKSGYEPKQYSCDTGGKSAGYQISGGWGQCTGRNLEVAVESWARQGACSFSCNDEPVKPAFLCTMSSDEKDPQISGAWGQCATSDLEVTVLDWSNPGPCTFVCG